MNYKKTWFGWLNFGVGTLFMGVFLFASLVSLFEFYGVTVSLFNIVWLRLSFVLSVAIMAGLIGIVILWHFIKKKIPFSDSIFDNTISNSITNILFIAIIVAGVFLRINMASGSGTLDFNSSKYYDKIMIVFNYGKLSGSDAITLIYCNIGAFLLKVFGLESNCLSYFNIVLQMFAFVFLFYAIKLSYGKTVALFSFSGMFLTTLPMGYINKISPDSLILFLVSLVIMTISLFNYDWSTGVVKSNANIALFVLFSVILGILIALNPVLFIIPIYFCVRSLLVEKTNCEDGVVHKRFIPPTFYLGGSALVALLVLTTNGFLNNDILGTFYSYIDKIGFSSFIRFFVYPSDYLITSITCFAFAFICFIYFVFSNSDYISAITVLFAVLYVVYAKNMISYDLSFYFVILFALYMGLGVKRMFFEGYGSAPFEESVYENDEEKDEVNDVKVDFDEIKEMNVMEEKQAKQEEKHDEGAADKEKIEFIQNILPLPKPHVKKNMDYAFEPSEMEMKYDYEVSEEDDFDLP